MKNSKIALIASGSVIAAVALSIWGGSLLYADFHTGRVHYDTTSDGPASGDLSAVLPAFVPGDATDIEAVYSTTGPGYDIRYRSSTGYDRSQCTPANNVPKPALPQSWIPSARPVDVVKCAPSGVHAAIYVVVSGHSVVGWDGPMPAPKR